MLDRASIEQLFEAVGTETAKELLTFFIAEARERVGRIKDLTEQGNSGGSIAEDLAREAHSMKSTAMTYGLPELGERARELEMSCKAGKTDPGLAAQVCEVAESTLTELADFLVSV
ncbi:MAG: Hpt domain-containing protein [Rhodospirillales bacterium]|nr:Hpt domain-containing protein [Rhodospirillales bacterium]